MTTPSSYVVRIIWDGVAHYLLWKDGGEKPDHFFLNKDGGVFVGTSLLSALQVVRSLGEDANTDEVRDFDFDSLWTLLLRNQQDPVFSAAEYKVILDGWNLLEDMARSMKLTLVPQEENRSLIQSIYEQVFLCADVIGVADQDTLDDTRKEILEVTSYRTGERDCPKLTPGKTRVALEFLESAWSTIRADTRWRE